MNASHDESVAVRAALDVPLPENAAIARLQEALDAARAWPPWTIKLIAVLAALSFVVLLHLLALLLVGPWAWAAYQRRRLPSERELVPLKDPESASAEESAPAAERAAHPSGDQCKV